MEIELVSDKRDMDRFIRFPWKVYAGNPHWVPPLVNEMKFILGEKNPFFRHAEAAYFLASKNGVTIGRIAAIIDRNHINYHNDQAGFFGFFECLPGQDEAAGEAIAHNLRDRLGIDPAALIQGAYLDLLEAGGLPT